MILLFSQVCSLKLRFGFLHVKMSLYYILYIVKTVHKKLNWLYSEVYNINISSYFLSQNQVLPRLSSLFGVLLSDGSWLLHQHALEAFSQFAEV